MTATTKHPLQQLHTHYNNGTTTATTTTTERPLKQRSSHCNNITATTSLQQHHCNNITATTSLQHARPRAYVAVCELEVPEEHTLQQPHRNMYTATTALQHAHCNNHTAACTIARVCCSVCIETYVCAVTNSGGDKEWGANAKT